MIIDYKALERERIRRVLIQRVKQEREQKFRECLKFLVA